MAFVNHTKRRQLTQVELDSCKDAVVINMQEITKLEAELKREQSRYRAMLKPHKEALQANMVMLNSGFDEGSAWCRVALDPVARVVRFLKSVRKKNEDTQRYEEVEELFDEKSFDEYSEAQLTIWQSGEEDDRLDALCERLYESSEFEPLQDFLVESERESVIDPYDFVDLLAKPCPEEANAYYLAAAGHPYSVVNVAAASGGIVSALDMIATDLEDLAQLREFGNLLVDGLGVTLAAIVQERRRFAGEEIEEED